MAVPFLDLRSDYEAVRSSVAERFARVLDSQTFVLGPQTAELESRMRALCAVPYAFACASGTDALLLALLACGVGAGDAVVVPAFTFFATAGAVRRAGALPVFADVDAETQNMGVRELEEALGRAFERRSGATVHRASGARLRAVIAVSLYGRAADAAALARAAGQAGAVLVEDAAQAIGAAVADGPVGSRSAAACFSFYPTKNVGAAGDGGLVTTTDPERATRIRRLRTHGAEPGEALHFECGLNARMDELQAAFVNAKLDRLEQWTAARASAAGRYGRGLASLAGSQLRLPPPAAPPAHVWHQYVVRISCTPGTTPRTPGTAAGTASTTPRDRVRERLAERGIETRVFYPVPLHLQPCFADLGYGPGSLPVAERLASEVLSLPLYASIGGDRVDAVCEALVGALRA